VLALAVPAVGEPVYTTTLSFTPPSNAYWQIVDDSGGEVLACVLEGQDHYGNGDDCSIYNADAVDFTGALVIDFEFDISLVTDSDNDHCVFQMKDSDDSSWTTIDYFAADTVGYERRTYDFVCGGLGDWSACDSVYFRFRWVSDGSGTDVGVRIDDVFLEYGDLEYVRDEIFKWYDEDDKVQTHEIWDLSPWLTPGEDFYLEWWYYNYETTDIEFWGIDDVWVYDAKGDLLRPEPFDDWLPDGWWEDHQSGGYWEQESVTGWRDPLAPSGNPVAACDGREYPHFYAELYSPLINNITDTAVTVDFYSSFKCEEETHGDCVSFSIWHGDLPRRKFVDDFEGDLSLWTVVDEGSGNLDVTPSSVGKIKAAYR
jgi:hypothetical protein